MDRKTDETEYMSVGTLAQKMGISIRTLQYYDKKGLIHPSGKQKGNRRQYTHKDMIKLHQILSLKYLGFSLDEIKVKLQDLNTPDDVLQALHQQAATLRPKITNLSRSLEAIDALTVEVKQMQRVDFVKYADIIVNLQMENQYYQLIKHFDDQTLLHVRNRFDKESGVRFLNRFTTIVDDVIRLQDNQIPHDDARAQAIAEVFWSLIMEFTNGDMTLLPNLMEIGTVALQHDEYTLKISLATAYLEKALEVYFVKNGIQPFPKEVI